MSIDCVIQVKMLLFLRTILVEDDDEDLGKIILINRARAYADNTVAGRANEFSRPILIF